MRFKKRLHRLEETLAAAEANIERLQSEMKGAIGIQDKRIGALGSRVGGLTNRADSLANRMALLEKAKAGPSNPLNRIGRLALPRTRRSRR